jgi:hypothetical protein
MSAAADAAKTALGTTTTKVVLAWVTIGQESAFTQLAAKFTSAKIYGIPVENLFTTDGRDRMAIVIALGGQINAAHTVKPNTNFTTAGSQVGTDLKAIQTGATDSKLAILVGDCNNPSDAQVVTGFLSTFGNTAWVTGGSTGLSFSDGKSNTASILGILLYGAFDCRFGFEQGGTVPVAQTALTSSNDPAKKPTFSIIFDCVSRHEGLGASGLTSEMNAFQQTLGATTPFFGGYVLGEIGKKNLTANAYGTGGAISVVNFYTRVGTSIAFENNPSVSLQQIPSLISSKSATQYRINGTIAKSINAQPAGVIVTKEGTKNIKVNSQAIVK